MKRSSYSICFLFFVFLVSISGFVGLVSAIDSKTDPYPYNYSKFENVPQGGKSPVIEYPVWGYVNESYNFTVNYSILPESVLNNSTMVLYWDSWNKSNDYNYSLLNDKHYNKDNRELRYNHTWDKSGIYGVSVGIFDENKKPINVSYWMTIQIKNKNVSKVDVNSFFMLDEIERFDGNRSSHLYDHIYLNLTNFSIDKIQTDYYCGYLKNDYGFSATFNLNGQKKSVEKDERVKAVFNWGEDSSNDSTGRQPIKPENNHNFTHEWDKTGDKKITVQANLRDSYNASKDLLSGTKSRNILIIRDPKNFVSSDRPYISVIIEPFSNLQNLGIFLVSAGLMILFFTYSKNKVPVKISILGIKPFYLKSVDTFIGIFTFIAGMYLYSVFGRCPWDIPFLEKLGLLPDIYFSMLYYEYAIQKWNVPYLCILLGLVNVSFISLIIYRIGSPFLKGDLENIRLLRGKRPLIPLLNTLSFSLKRKK